MKKQTFHFLLLFLMLFSSLNVFAATVDVAQVLKTSKTFGDNKNLPTVAVISTGGTIAEKTDPKTGGAVPEVSGSTLVEAVPGLLKVANIMVVTFSNIDSSQMTPELWLKLSQTVDELLKQSDTIKGVVITHGTDTMAQAAYFLEITLDTNKPVVFTGAMRDASDPSPDGPVNILNAVRQVLSPQAKNWGVTVSLDNYINCARDVRKTQSINPQTFKSGQKGYLGYIYNTGKVNRFHEKPDTPKIPRPKSLPKVVYLATYPGANGGLVRHAVDSGAKGIVVDAVGAGNVNADVYKAIKYALSKNIPVVITTQVYHGGVHPIYGDEGGGATLQKNGAILGGDLTGQKARLLLMVALTQAQNDKAKLKSYFK